jgi:hypothetical protein
VRADRDVPRSSPERGFSYYVDADGAQHFNFPQSVWLAPGLAMAFTPTRSAALRTLAVNVLTAVSGERSLSVARGRTSAQVLALAGGFCEEILLCAPEEAWTLPHSSVADWLAAHRSVGPAPGLRAPLRPDLR